MKIQIKRLEKEFVEQGGIKERMYAARTGYRKHQDEKMNNLEAENAVLKTENKSLWAENARLKTESTSLKAENTSLSSLASQWKAKYDDLRSRALAAYYKQQDEIKDLKEKLEASRSRASDDQR